VYSRGIRWLVGKGKRKEEISKYGQKEGETKWFLKQWLSVARRASSRGRYVRMTTPCRRVVLASYSINASSSLEHSDESSLYPHLAPPQSSLTLSPDRVMPYRSHVQQLLLELTLDGDELLVERDVRDGTLEPESESESMYESSPSE
jgi:hypothetical protein